MMFTLIMITAQNKYFVYFFRWDEKEELEEEPINSYNYTLLYLLTVYLTLPNTCNSDSTLFLWYLSYYCFIFQVYG